MQICMNLEQELMRRLGEIKEARGLRKLAEAAGVDQGNMSRALGEKRQMLGLDKVSRLLDAMGAKVTFPDQPQETARDVCFVNAKVVPAGEFQQPPQADDYMAVPLVEEVGAGPGIIPQGEMLSWFLVYKHQDAVRFRRNLVAVQIGKESTSMEPILQPRDIVLVDLDDKDTRKPGRIMLVMDPDGSGMIKRVAVDQKENDYRITFYSDNAAENPPVIYSWREDYLKDWSKVVAGRVVWAWSDFSGK